MSGSPARGGDLGEILIFIEGKYTQQTSTVPQALVSLITLTTLAYSPCQNPQLREDIFQMPLSIKTAAIERFPWLFLKLEKSYLKPLQKWKFAQLFVKLFFFPYSLHLQLKISKGKNKKYPEFGHSRSLQEEKCWQCLSMLTHHTSTFFFFLKNN